jgi:hypothetical protein
MEINCETVFFNENTGGTLFFRCGGEKLNEKQTFVAADL